MLDRIKELRGSADGLEKNFKEAVAALETLRKSHKLTLNDLRKKKTELTAADSHLVRVWKENKEQILVLNPIKEVLKDSEANVKRLRAERDQALHNYEVSKENC